MKLDKLRIALLTYSTQPRGSVVHTLELAEALHQMGHKVCVYALDKDGQGFKRSLACDYKLVPTRCAPAAVDQLIQQRIDEFVDYFNQFALEYDCYHAQDCISANALGVLKRNKKIPHFIRTVHHIEDYPSIYLQQCQNRSIREADLCLCVSETWQTALRQQYQIHAPRVINGVNTQRFSPLPQATDAALRQQLGLNGSPIYLTVGGIEPRKNSIALLQAFAEVLVDYPDAQLVIAGGATLFDYQPYRDQFFALAQRFKVGDRLVLPGVVVDEDLAALYRSADAFVFPSVKEGWGLVVLEAIAAGLPVITSNQPPFTEFLSPTQALWVDPQAPASIAQAMRWMIALDLKQTIVQQSQEVLAEYTWQASADLHVQCYRQLLSTV